MLEKKIKTLLRYFQSMKGGILGIERSEYIDTAIDDCMIVYT